jgi:sugar lactone lactonase YvrE
LFYPTDSPRDALQEADWTGKVLGHFGIKCFSTECSPSKGQIQHAGQVVVDARGNVYVLDVSAPAVIKFSRSGSVLSVVGKGGTAPGEFTGPQGVALDTAGNIYVADTGNNRIQKFSPDGQLLAVTGKPGTKPGEFNTPTDIGVDREGNVYVLDSGNNRIQKFVPGT